MTIQPLNLLSAQPAARTYALLSVGAALLTIIPKTTAYLLTGSVGLLSDALESGVNLVAALVAVWALTLAIRPADADDCPAGRRQFGRFLRNPRNPPICF